MRNEMGNQNTSGIKEEEKAASEVPEEAQEAGNEDEAMKEENNIIPADQTKDVHEKAEDSPYIHVSDAIDTNAIRHESDEKEQRKESESDELLELSRESTDSVSQVDSVDRADSSYESNMEHILPTIDKLHIHDQYPIEGETNEGQAESSSSNSVVKLVRDSKPADDSTSPPEEGQILLLQDDAEVNKLCRLCPMQEEEKKGDMDRKDKINALESEESVCLAGEVSEKNAGVEECDKTGMEKIFENGQGNNDAVEVSLEGNLVDIPSSPTRTVPEVSSQNLLAACPEPKEKHIVHAKEKFTHVKSENGENKIDSDQAQLSQLTVNQLIEATASTTLHEDLCKENGDESMVRMSSISDLGKVLQTDGDKLIKNGSKGISAGMKKFVSPGQEQHRNTEEITVMPEIVSISKEFKAIDKHDKETAEKYFVQETEKRTLEPWLKRKSTHNRGRSQSFYSFGGENELVPGCHISQINSENGPGAGYPTSSFNSHSGNGTLMGSRDAEDKNKFTVSHEVFINEMSSCNAQNVYMQTPNPCSDAVQGRTQKVQMDSGTVPQSEMWLSQSNKHNMTDETSPLQRFKAQESDERLSIDSNPDHPSHRGQLRKSPSFEFGLPPDARSEESDQTPLLIHEKSLARSFSGSANVKFQHTMTPPDYGRKSVDYEPIQVEEKTIRMERSISDISRDSFVNFLKKDAKISIEKQDSHAAEEKASESPSQELALTSVKPNGKRKPRSSLFSACICCSAVIH